MKLSKADYGASESNQERLSSSLHTSKVALDQQEQQEHWKTHDTHVCAITARRPALHHHVELDESPPHAPDPGRRTLREYT